MLPDEGKAPLRPNWLRSRMAKWAGLAYRLGLGTLVAKKVMILTTKGRVTGRARRTPLWYVRDRDTVYCLSGWGPSSDWWKNLNKETHALVQIGKGRLETQGVLVENREEVSNVLNMFFDKYGRRTVHLFYHLDRLCLAAFSLEGSGEPPPRACSHKAECVEDECK